MRSATRVTLAALLVVGAATVGCSADDVGTYSSSLGPPPGEYTLQSPDGVARIPFEVYRDKIMMVGEINGRKVRMMIDNGVMWDEVLLFGSPLIDSLGLSYADETEITGAGEGEGVSSDVAVDVLIAFPGVAFTGQTAIVTPQSQGFAEAWEADGQVCGTFFKHFVVSMDFDESVISLIPPEDFVWDGEGQELSLTPVGAGSWAFPGTVVMPGGREVSLLLTMDLGGIMPLSVSISGGGVLAVPEGAEEAILGYGVQGAIRGHRAVLPALLIGDREFTDVPAGFSTTAGNESSEDGVIVGFPVLSRFNVVFDHTRERLYLSPNRRFAVPFE